MQPNILIASPQLRDPNFERTVVLLWQYDAEGAAGVVVNRTMPHLLTDVLDKERDLDLRPYRDDHVAWGGPVDRFTGTAITRGVVSDDEGWTLEGGLAVTRSQETLRRLITDRRPVLLCLGYAGWSPGQLDREIELGGWLFTDCDAALVFDVPIAERYDRALATLGVTASDVWMKPVNE